jgi:hypothetical protein
MSWTFPWAVLMLTIGLSVVPGAALAQAPAAGGGSTELVGLLAKEMGSSTKQAQGAAGSLFRLAKTRMSPEDFGKVATAVPGMDGLLKAAPALGGKAGAAAALGQAVGDEGLGSMAGVVQSFKKLGLKADMVKKAVPVLTNYVGKKGGGDLAKLLGDSLL